MKDQFKDKAQQLADQAKKSGGQAKGQKSERSSRADDARGAGRERGEGMQDRMRDEFGS
jgi:hypothetical protein